jgi:hypothetical protein
MPQTPSMSAEEARAALERLREITDRGNPYQQTPRLWIAELHEIIEVIAIKEVRSVYRLDGLYGVTVGYLHNRVLDVLRDFDRLVAEQDVVEDHGA